MTKRDRERRLGLSLNIPNCRLDCGISVELRVNNPLLFWIDMRAIVCAPRPSRTDFDTFPTLSGNLPEGGRWRYLVVVKRQTVRRPRRNDALSSRASRNQRPVGAVDPHRKKLKTVFRQLVKRNRVALWRKGSRGFACRRGVNFLRLPGSRIREDNRVSRACVCVDKFSSVTGNLRISVLAGAGKYGFRLP